MIQRRSGMISLLLASMLVFMVQPCSGATRFVRAVQSRLIAPRVPKREAGIITAVTAWFGFGKKQDIEKASAEVAEKDTQNNVWVARVQGQPGINAFYGQYHDHARVCGDSAPCVYYSVASLIQKCVKGQKGCGERGFRQRNIVVLSSAEKLSDPVVNECEIQGQLSVVDLGDRNLQEHAEIRKRIKSILPKWYADDPYVYIASSYHKGVNDVLIKNMKTFHVVAAKSTLPSEESQYDAHFVVAGAAPAEFFKQEGFITHDELSRLIIHCKDDHAALNHIASWFNGLQEFIGYISKSSQPVELIISGNTVAKDLEKGFPHKDQLIASFELGKAPVFHQHPAHDQKPA